MVVCPNKHCPQERFPLVKRGSVIPVHFGSHNTAPNSQKLWLFIVYKARPLTSRFLLRKIWFIVSMAFPVLEFSREGYKIRKVFG